jgi:hypothetical protein
MKGAQLTVAEKTLQDRIAHLETELKCLKLLAHARGRLLVVTDRDPDPRPEAG